MPIVSPEMLFGFAGFCVPDLPASEAVKFKLMMGRCVLPQTIQL
jgi:hypothetical protein